MYKFVGDVDEFRITPVRADISANQTTLSDWTITRCGGFLMRKIMAELSFKLWLDEAMTVALPVENGACAAYRV